MTRPRDNPRNDDRPATLAPSPSGSKRGLATPPAGYPPTDAVATRESGADARSSSGNGNAAGTVGGKRFLSAAEVGELLGIRRSRVYELVAGGALPHIRLSPRKIVFPLRAIEAMEADAIAQAREAQARLRDDVSRWGVL